MLSPLTSDIGESSLKTPILASPEMHKPAAESVNR